MATARFASFRLIAEDLSLERGGRKLLAHVDLALESGQALAITGANGAGKSTMLRALAGLLPPAQGRVRLVGAPDEDVASHAHYVGHLDASKPTLTARENLVFWQAMLSLREWRTALTPQDALARLGLPHVADLPVGYLSAGQKRRVGLARLLLAPRPLWLLDEPTTALDRAAQAIFAGCMRDHLAEGGIIVAATHAPLGIDAQHLELGAPQAALAAPQAALT
ncbi:MAG: ccmA [Hyphomicrobiales bacterium]|nr:ccmA [Hyphomicrobiales bacterium]